ncbi:MAG: DUF523 domain-containing protein [Firmicutes bacterium]|nr:DUF523 domain-containing protein [Bacillota bacterium]
MNTASVLVSACLGGKLCRYDGQIISCPRVEKLVRDGKAVPFCPEVAGGLAVPRPPAEIQGGDGKDVLQGRGWVQDIKGRDVTDAYLRGAQAGLALVQRLGIRRAILKEKSPACGVHSIYDGSFKNRLRKGRGVLAAALEAAGVELEQI